MKGKLLGFALALVSVATLGVVQLQLNAQVPGQVGNAPRCTVTAVGARGNAFHPSGNRTTVTFNVKGKSSCRVQLSANSFYAPTMNGKPYNKQILYQRVTKVYKPGRYSLSVGLPTKSTPAKGCYYQVDLTYGVHNVTPVLAYGHGKIAGCGQPNPTAACKAVTVAKLERTKFRFTGSATVAHGAKVKSYMFAVYNKSGTVVYRHTGTSRSLTYVRTTPGTYRVKLTVNTTVGAKTNSTSCVKSFTVTPPPANPVASCKELTVDKLSRTSFRFNGSASVSGGAKVTAYVFTVYKGSDVVSTHTVSTSALNASYNYSQSTEGDYTVKLTVKTSVGDKTGADCQKPFTVTPPPANPQPGVSIEKTVEHEKYKRVGVNVQYHYEVAVTNTGDVDLKNVKVTDTPEDGVTLVSASDGTVTDNTWNYTIPSLAKGETRSFTLTAKVPVYKAGLIKNTACVDASEVPGNPDDCDSANVDVPKPGKTTVCNPETSKIITVDKEDADNYLPVDSDECAVTPTTPVTPSELPTTGAADTALKLIGVTSLTGATVYYMASRRNS